MYVRVWTGSRPGPREIDLARRRGVAKAIDVSACAPREPSGLAEACARAGIEYVPIEAPKEPHEPLVDRVLEELRRSEERPVLLVSRTGWHAPMLVAIRRAVDEGMPVEDAVAEARRAGMKPGEPERFVREQVARLAGR